MAVVPAGGWTDSVAEIPASASTTPTARLGLGPLHKRPLAKSPLVATPTTQGSLMGQPGNCSCWAGVFMCFSICVCKLDRGKEMKVYVRVYACPQWRGGGAVSI